MPDLALEILPPRVYVERTGVGQLLNFDLHLKNDGSEDVRLASVALEVLDGSGAVVLRRVVDEHGLRPAIETIPERNVPAGGSLLVFNPLHTFPPDLELARLRVACELGDASLAAELSPIEYRQRTGLHLPLAGRVLVAAGHDFLSPHRRIDPAHPLAAQLGVRTNSGRYADDYALECDSLGAVVRAPGAGTVVARRGDVPDNMLGPDGVEFAQLPPDPAAMIERVQRQTTSSTTASKSSRETGWRRGSRSRGSAFPETRTTRISTTSCKTARTPASPKGCRSRSSATARSWPARSSSLRSSHTISTRWS